MCEMLCVIFFFFFKQKTAYEMRISDWSSDVCSSDLLGDPQFRHVQRGVVQFNEERVLRLDVVVERSTQHARLFADVAHRCPAIAFSGEQPRSHLHDLTASAGTLVTRSKRRDRAGHSGPLACSPAKCAKLSRWRSGRGATAEGDRKSCVKGKGG